MAYTLKRVPIPPAGDYTGMKVKPAAHWTGDGWYLHWVYSQSFGEFYGWEFPSYHDEADTRFPGMDEDSFDMGWPFGEEDVVTRQDLIDLGFEIM